LTPAAEARGLALATVSLTLLDRLLQNGTTLVAPAAPMPLDPGSVRDLLLSQSGLPPEVSSNLDFGAPAGAAVVPLGPGATGFVVAVAARGPAEAARVVSALGRQVERRGDFAQVEGGSGQRLWLLQDGAVIAFAESIEALAHGARLAEEARRAGAEDVTAVLFPDAIAKANGTDVKTAIAMAIEQMKAVQAAQPGGAAIDARAYATLTEMLSLLGDADPIELGLVADPTRGLSLRARLRARTASGLERVAKDAKPYELDGTLLLAAKSPLAVGAWSLGSFMRGQMMHQREALQASKAKGATGALAFVDALIAGLAGQTSIAFGVGKEPASFTGALAYPLKDAAAAAAVAGSLDRLDKDAAVALVEAQVGRMPFVTWTFKKESAGKLKAIHWTAAFDKKLGLDPELTNKLFGKGVDVYMAVAGTRLLATFGRDAKKNLGVVAAGKPVAADGALADTLAATKGRDGFFHFDAAPVLGLVAAIGKDKDPRAQMLAKAGGAPIPLYGSAGGDGAGRVFSFDLTIPPLAFKNAGAVIKAGMSGGAGGPPPAEAPKGTGKAKKK
jgi:hypothetical protein